MRIRLSETEKQRSFKCECLHNNIVLESLVIVLTLVSALAVTGENLILFDLIIVPQFTDIAPDVTHTSGNNTQGGSSTIITENSFVMDILTKVLHFTSLGIAGLFFLEIVLKLCTIQKKCFTNPWQIFDAVVVVATLTLELVFHFVIVSEQALISLTYVVILRLWRLPMVCSISKFQVFYVIFMKLWDCHFNISDIVRAKEVQEASDCDNELYRSGRLKAEEKCKMLENTIVQQTETIRKLEKLLHNITSSKQSHVITNECHAITNGHQLNKPLNLNETFSIGSELLSLPTSQRSLRSNLLSNSHKLSKIKSLNDMETPFMITPEAELPTFLCELHSQIGNEVTEENTKICQNKIKTGDCASKTVDYSKSNSDCVDGEVKSARENQTFQDTDTSKISNVPSSQQTQILLRQRKRRSSASEILDYISTNFLDIDTVLNENDKASSCQNFGLDCEKSFSNDVFDNGNNNITDYNTETSVNTSTDLRDKFISMNLEEKKILQDRKRKRRFASCPEYVYTQRMNITNDESMLIEDGHTTDEHLVYNNLGFDLGENASFQVVAEFDGTKTYRNEDGIPMTSL